MARSRLDDSAPLRAAPDGITRHTARQDPLENRPAELLRLQRSAGNRAVGTLLAPATGRAGPSVQRAPIADFDDGRPEHDASRLTDAQVQGTDEYQALMARNPVPIPMRDVLPEEALLACRLFLRHLRQSPTPVAATTAVLDHWLAVARARGAVTETAEGTVGQQEWVAVGPSDVRAPGTADSDFFQWMLAGGRQPNPRTGKLNCWEMVLFSAFRAGYLDEARMRTMYTQARDAMTASGDDMDFPRTLERLMRSTSEQVYDPANRTTPRPLRGDMVIFQEAASHVALATGRMVGGRVEVVSHWPPPDGDHAVKRTTIEALLPAVGVSVAKFWSPVW